MRTSRVGHGAAAAQREHKRSAVIVAPRPPQAGRERIICHGCVVGKSLRNEEQIKAKKQPSLAHLHSSPCGVRGGGGGKGFASDEVSDGS